MSKAVFSDLYIRIFRVAPGEMTLKFWKNVTTSFVGEGGVIFISLFVYILSVRYLGPTEFGKWSLVGSTGELLAILPLMGLASASLVFLGKGSFDQKKLVGSVIWTVVVLSIILFPSYLALESVVSPLIKIDSQLLIAGIIYAFFFLWAQLFQAFFKGTDQFRKLSKFLILSAVIFATITITSLLVFKVNTFESLLWGNIARTLSLILAGLIVFRESILYFSMPIFKTVSSYGTLSMLSAILGFLSLGSIDNLMINHYLDINSVGIYAAYYIIFSLVVGKVLGTVLQVFLPLVAKVEDLRPTLKKIAILLIPSSIILFVLSILATKVAFIFYGGAFVFDISIAALVSLAATIYFLKAPFESILVSRGISGMKFGPLIALVLGVSNVVFNMLLIPPFGLHGAAIGTGLSALIALLLIFYLIHKNFISQKPLHTLKT